MRFCSIAAVYVMCFGVCAAPGYTLQQTKSFIHSAIQLKNPAKEVAETLHKMKLSEHQDLATVEGLQGPGAGPKTGAVLKELATESAALQEAQPPAPKPVYVPPRPPSSERGAGLRDGVRHSPVNYPPRPRFFIGRERPRRYVDANGREAWRLVD